MFGERVRRRGPQQRLALAAALATSVAGLLHIYLAVQQLHSAAHSLFFLCAGTLQLVSGGHIWLRRSLPAYRLAAILNGLLITLWVITRLLAAPFEPGPEAVDAAGLVTQLLQATAVAALLVLAARGGVQRSRALRAASTLLLLAILSGWLSYGLGHFAEQVLPRPAEALHQHGDHTH